MKLLSLWTVVSLVSSQTIFQQPQQLLNSFSSTAAQFINSSLLPAIGDMTVNNDDGKLTVPQLIVKYGYPVEFHNITTEDGYILTAHRIPYGGRCGPGQGKRVVLLQHGSIWDSSTFILTGPERGLGYNLADECYDVWLGNFRGNRYSRNHVRLDPDKNKEEFWSFSWNEMGIYDIPASIDYILNITGADGLYFIGYSMGNTAFWACMSERPEYNSKIKLMIAYGPIAYVDNMTSPFRLLAPFTSNIEWQSEILGLHELTPSTKLTEFFGQTVCNQVSPVREVCSSPLLLIYGYDSEQFDRDILPVFFGHTPAGSSVQTLTHYGQLINSKSFRKFDFGRERNLEVYKTLEPPDYLLEKITAPVAIYWGANDWLAVKSDVDRLVKRLPNVQLMHRVNFDGFNHLDFVLARDNDELINRPTIEFMRNF